jgi:short-subunit dehydrogenase
VLVGRQPDRLASLADAVSADGSPGVETLVADLAEPVGLIRVEARCADRAAPIDLLVNNAGLLGRIAALADQPSDSLDELLDVDIRTVLRLCRAVLPVMLARGSGQILNVSSVMAFLPAPQGATYAAAKAFVNSFSESVHCETRRRGVHVTAVCPGSVRTDLHRTSGRRGGRLGPFLRPDDVVRAGLAAVTAGRPICVPGPTYPRVALLSRLAPRSMVRAFVLRRFHA